MILVAQKICFLCSRLASRLGNSMTRKHWYCTPSALTHDFRTISLLTFCLEGNILALSFPLQREVIIQHARTDDISIFRILGFKSEINHV